jgi:hypothetical protein
MNTEVLRQASVSLMLAMHTFCPLAAYCEATMQKAFMPPVIYGGKGSIYLSTGDQVS